MGDTRFPLLNELCNPVEYYNNKINKVDLRGLSTCRLSELWQKFDALTQISEELQTEQAKLPTFFDVFDNIFHNITNIEDVSIYRVMNSYKRVNECKKSLEERINQYKELDQNLDGIIASVYKQIKNMPEQGENTIFEGYFNENIELQPE